MKSPLVIVLLCFAIQIVAGQPKVIHSKYSKNDIIINGLEDEMAWSGADSISFNGNICNSKNVVVVKTLWNNDFLYFLFKVSDENLQAHQTEQDHPQLFLDDMVELLIDTTNDKDSCWNEDKIIYHINLLGAKKDDRGTADCFSDPAWNGNAVYSVKLFGTLNSSEDIDSGYNVEIAVPWPELGVSPENNLVLGVNFANGDNNNNGRQLFDWVGAYTLRSPQLFGNLLLSAP